MNMRLSTLLNLSHYNRMLKTGSKRLRYNLDMSVTSLTMRSTLLTQALNNRPQGKNP